MIRILLQVTDGRGRDDQLPAPFVWVGVFDDEARLLLASHTCFLGEVSEVLAALHLGWPNAPVQTIEGIDRATRAAFDECNNAASSARCEQTRG